MAPRREYPTRPIAAVGAVIFGEGKALLVRRRNPPNEGRWCVSGGIVELGETTQEAVAREVKEELGIDVEVRGLVDVASDVHLDDKGKVKYHFVIADYIAQPAGGSVRLNSESSAYGWFSVKEVKGLEMAEATKRVVLKALQSAG